MWQPVTGGGGGINSWQYASSTPATGVCFWGYFLCPALYSCLHPSKLVIIYFMCSIRILGFFFPDMKPLYCYECQTSSDDPNYCSDPFNATMLANNVSICEGHCVKWVRQPRPGQWVWSNFFQYYYNVYSLEWFLLTT